MTSSAKPLTVTEAIAFLEKHDGPASRHYWAPLIEAYKAQEKTVADAAAVLAEERCRCLRLQEQACQRERELIQEASALRTELGLLKASVEQANASLAKSLNTKRK